MATETTRRKDEALREQFKLLKQAESKRDSIAENMKVNWFNISDDKIARMKVEHKELCSEVKKIQKKIIKMGGVL